VLVIAEPTPAGGEKPLNAFETLSLAPIERKLIDVTMLTEKERTWLDSYHQRVRETIGPLLDSDTRKWLEKATNAL
jgi:Xaa-Pro aminopeptidase